MTETIWFRGDGAASIGLGHLARLTALAAEAGRRGYAQRFVVNDDDAARDFLRGRGFLDVAISPPRADDEIKSLAGSVGAGGRLVTDLRAKDPTFYLWLRDAGLLICAVDDMGEPVAAQVVVNGGAAPRYRDGYAEIRPPQKFLLGTSYIPLAPVFAEVPPAVNAPGRTRLLLTFGGADPSDYTRRALRALEAIEARPVDVALGPAYPHAAAVYDLAKVSRHDVDVHYPARDMLPLYHRARVALGAGGVTQYELLARGVPVVSIPHVEREKAECDAFAAAGAVRTFPAARFEDAVEAVEGLWNDEPARAALAGAGRELVDGRGAARILDVFLGLTP